MHPSKAVTIEFTGLSSHIAGQKQIAYDLPAPASVMDPSPAHGDRLVFMSLVTGGNSAISSLDRNQ